jgi:hypothetical protein
MEKEDIVAGRTLYRETIKRYRFKPSVKTIEAIKDENICYSHKGKELGFLIHVDIQKIENWSIFKRKQSNQNPVITYYFEKDRDINKIDGDERTEFIKKTCPPPPPPPPPTPTRPPRIMAPLKDPRPINGDAKEGIKELKDDDEKKCFNCKIGSKKFYAGKFIGHGRYSSPDEYSYVFSSDGDKYIDVKSTPYGIEVHHEGNTIRSTTAPIYTEVSCEEEPQEGGTRKKNRKRKNRSRRFRTK